MDQVQWEIYSNKRGNITDGQLHVMYEPHKELVCPYGLKCLDLPKKVGWTRTTKLEELLLIKYGFLLGIADGHS